MFKKIKTAMMTKTKKTDGKNNLSSARGESSFYSTSPSSARSESSKKTSISNDVLERSVYSPDVANISSQKMKQKLLLHCLLII